MPAINSKIISIEEKLTSIYRLQIIHSEIDRLNILKGELPEEIEDLRNQIEGMEKKISILKTEIDKMKFENAERTSNIEKSQELIKRYKEQQNNIRNNKEYENLEKEIEYQELEIELTSKRIKEGKLKQKNKKDTFSNIENLIKDKKELLNIKKSELSEIIAETEIEEQKLLDLSLIAEQDIESRLLKIYKRIREKSDDKQGIVTIDKGSSLGSFIVIPPQVLIDISTKKRIIIDEYSGKILIDRELADNVKEYTVKEINKLLDRV